MYMSCPICLDTIEINDISKPYICNHIYHKDCIKNLYTSGCKRKYNCSLCNERVKYEYKYTNFVFNNMLEGEKIFDIDIYINKWKYKNCIINNHKLLIETLGDWDMSSTRNLVFTYKSMYIECLHCKSTQIINKLI